VRDERRREIVVAFRGSHELADMVTGTHFVPTGAPSRSARSSVINCVFADGNLVLIPLVSRGIDKNNTASVHAGFLISYNSVRAVVVHVVRDQLLAFPNYTVVISGSHPLYSALRSDVLINEWRRTLVGRRARVHRCAVCQVEFPIGGSSAIHLWCVIQVTKLSGK
jgi:Lipase (class 3)